MKVLALFMLLPLAACGPFPRDPDGTLEHIRASGEFRVGVIADGADAPEMDRARRLVDRLAQETGARPVYEWGGAARLLPLVEAGELDLVIGRFDRPSPWQSRVALSTPIARLRLPPDRQDLRAAAQKGENAWIALVENSAYAVREPVS